jgi:hypothetical protein
MARRIVARLGDRLLVSPTVSDREVLRPVILGIEAVNQWRSDEGREPAVKWGESDAGPGARGASYTVLAVVHGPEADFLPLLVKAISPYGLESSTVVKGDDYRLLIFRVAHHDKSLEQSEIDKLSAAIDRVLHPST